MKHVSQDIRDMSHLLGGLTLLLLALTVAGCAAPAPAVNVAGTVQASIAATTEAQQTMQAAINAAVAATAAAPAVRPAAAATSTLRPTDVPLPAATVRLTNPPSPTAAATAAPRPTATSAASDALHAMLLLGPGADVWGVAYSPDGRLVALASTDHVVSIWDAATGKRFRDLRGHTAEVSGVAFSSNGKWLATSGADATVRLWDVATGAELKRFSGHEDWVNTVAFGPGDTRLLTGSDDWTARIFDVASGAEVRRIEPGWSVNAASFSADGRRIALAGGVTMVSSGSEAAIYDANTGQLVRTFDPDFDPDTGSSIGMAKFSPDGRLLATGDYNSMGGPKDIFLWDTASGELLHRLLGHERGIARLDFSNDGRQLASCDSSATVIVWDVASGQALHVIEANADTLLCGVAFSPNGRYLVATGEPDGVANIWEVAALP